MSDRRRSEILDALGACNKVKRKLASMHPGEIDEILLKLADRTESQVYEILAENRKDLVRMDRSDPKYDRLELTEDRLAMIVRDLRSVVSMPTPLHRELEQRVVPSGLKLQKVSVPIGVIGVIYESRPNVTFDVFALCIKAGNAVVLKGSKDAHYSNVKIVEIIKDTLADHDLRDAVFLAPSERTYLSSILEASDLIDVIIPRGSQGLIDHVRAHATVPVIETGAGIVHIYYDKGADLDKGRSIILNSKTRRVSVCNALDCLLIHKARLHDLAKILAGADQQFKLKIYADNLAYEGLQGSYDSDLLFRATEDHFGTEFLSMQMAIKTVDGINEAMSHIDRYSSRHTEAVVTDDAEVADSFMQGVDAAAVYHNASTSFTDGAEFGLGAEIGISTQKLHARGPMGLNELTSYKWKVFGSGHIRS